MSKEEFIAKLQMVYVGDRNAFNELVSVYDNLQQVINRTIEINKKIIEEYKLIYGNESSKLLYSLETQSKILQGEKVK